MKNFEFVKTVSTTTEAVINVVFSCEPIEGSSNYRLVKIATDKPVEEENVWVSDFVIPSSYDGKKITSIAHDVFDACNKGPKKLDLSDDEFEFGDWEWPDNSVIDWGFGVRNLYIEDGIDDIASRAFVALKVENVRWPSSCSRLKHYTFLGVGYLQTITNTEGVTEVGDEAFSWCHNLKEIDLRNCQSIGKEAFRLCESLESFDWPQNCEVIPDDCFHQCKGLKHVNGIEKVKKIGKCAFADTSIKIFTWPEKCSVIPVFCFEGAPLENIHISGEIKFIEDYAFCATKIPVLDLHKSGVVDCGKDIVPKGTKIVKAQFTQLVASPRG
jgi:hypothetical protein